MIRTVTAFAVACLASAGLVAPATAATGGVGPWRHEVPPPVGTRLLPQPGLFRCASVAGARYSAETGFLAHDCARLEREPGWRVVACHEDALSHGPLRLIEVVAEDGGHGWIPLPWHDWI